MYIYKKNNNLPTFALKCCTLGGRSVLAFAGFLLLQPKESDSNVAFVIDSFGDTERETEREKRSN